MRTVAIDENSYYFWKLSLLTHSECFWVEKVTQIGSWDLFYPKFHKIVPFWSQNILLITLIILAYYQSIIFLLFLFIIPHRIGHCLVTTTFCALPLKICSLNRYIVKSASEEALFILKPYQTGQDRTRQGNTWQGKAGQSKAREDKAGQGKGGKAGQGKATLCKVRQGNARQGK